MIIINRYTCPIKNKVSIQAHQLNSEFRIAKSYPKMITDDYSLFESLDNVVLINDVLRSSMLSKINLIVKDK